MSFQLFSNDSYYNSKQPFLGKYFAITGTPSRMQASKLRSLIESKGGICVKRIPGADYLVVCDGFGRRKNKAEYWGVLCISEEDVINALNQPMIQDWILTEAKELLENSNTTKIEISQLTEPNKSTGTLFRFELVTSTSRSEVMLNFNDYLSFLNWVRSLEVLKYLDQLIQGLKNKEASNRLEITSVARTPVDRELQEKVSYNYVSLISSLAGFTYEQSSSFVDNLKIDATITGKVDNSIPRLSVQIKSVRSDSQTLRYTEDAVKYSIEAELFQLLKNNKDFIFILVVVPPTKEELYLECSGAIGIRLDAYWLAQPTETLGADQQTITVTIPKAQIFRTESLRDIMSRLVSGDDL